MNAGFWGTPYRPIAAKGWTNQPLIYTKIKVGETHLSYSVFTALNNNARLPAGFDPPTGSVYPRTYHLVCSADEDCITNPAWCCNTTTSVNGCPHQTWLDCNNGYNATHPFVSNYPTNSVLITSSICSGNQYGYKNVQAKKQWHGASGFTDVDTNACYNSFESCSGNYEIDYRTYEPASQTLYLSSNWNLNYSANHERLLVTGSYPWNCCITPAIPFYVYYTLPVYRAVCDVNRTVDVNRYSGEYTRNDYTIYEKVENYFVSDATFPNTQSIYDNCGNLFSTVNTSQWWTLEEITDCHTVNVSDFVGGYYDAYLNPYSGYKHVEDSNSPGNLLGTEMIINPVCSNNLTKLVDLVNIWNGWTVSTNNATDGNGIYIPNVAIGGWSGSDSFTAGYPDDTHGQIMFVSGSTTCPDGSTPFCYYSSSNSHGYATPSTCTVSVTRTATVYSFSIAIDAYVGNGSGNAFDHWVYSYNGAVTLSNAYTAQDLQNDLDTLLGKWDFTNDLIYPYRLDGYGNIAPLVSYDETAFTSPFGASVECQTNDYTQPLTDVYGNAPYSLAGDAGQHGIPTYDGSGYPPFATCWTPTYTSPVDWSPTFTQTSSFDNRVKCYSWTTGSITTHAANELVTLYDGAIIGGPNVSGSIAKINNWSWRHENWEYNQCVATGTGYYWFLKSYGEVNTGQFGIPLTATEWTNYNEAINLPPWSFNLNLGYVGWKQKWVEKKIKLNSHDFNRPYGIERYSPDLTACACDVESSSFAPYLGLYQNLSSSAYLQPQIPPAIGDVWGGTLVNGFYTITDVQGGSFPWYVLTGSQVLPLPSGFSESFCRLLYPTAKEFGTTPIITTYNTSSHSSSFYFYEPQNQYSGSASVDLYVPKLNLQGEIVPDSVPFHSNIIIYKTNDYSASAAGNYSGSRYLISSGSHPYWCDNGSKGQCITLQWTLDNRTNNEYARGLTQFDCNGNALTASFPPTNSGYSNFTATQIAISHSTVDGINVWNCGYGCDGYGAICYSNNINDDFNKSSGITYAIPSINYDLIYNSKWQGEIVQAQTKLGWQPDHKLCGYDPTNISIGADNGTCQPNDFAVPTNIKQFYGFPEQIEPFLTLPTTTLFNGSVVTATNPLSQSSYFSWQVLSPMVTGSGVTPPYSPNFSIPGGQPQQNLFLWLLRANICNSSCSLYDYDWISC